MPRVILDQLSFTLCKINQAHYVLALRPDTAMPTVRFRGTKKEIVFFLETIARGATESAMKEHCICAGYSMTGKQLLWQELSGEIVIFSNDIAVH